MQTLNDDDGRAVDVVLDAHEAGKTPGNGGAGNELRCPPAPPDMQQRVASAGRLLQVLANMPAEDPPPSLLSATLRFVEQRGAAPPAPQPDDWSAAYHLSPLV